MSDDGWSISAARNNFRRVLVCRQEKQEDPLAEAMIAWYVQLNRMQQLKIEDLGLQIITAVKRRNPRQAFGPKQALAVIGALVAHEEGWHGRAV